jgi:hypothetical protein
MSKATCHISFGHMHLLMILTAGAKTPVSSQFRTSHRSSSIMLISRMTQTSTYSRNSRSLSNAASSSVSSVNPEPGSRQSSHCWPGSTSPIAARFEPMASRYRSTNSPSGDLGSQSYVNSRSFSTIRSAEISRSAAGMRRGLTSNVSVRSLK